ncbi:hypothetical protein DFH06DRAFT_1394169 [Mycena polygramma]|nr:hypothetical protein DFH06DRAFT_1394169 [Mycena polygramma]
MAGCFSWCTGGRGVETINYVGSGISDDTAKIVMSAGKSSLNTLKSLSVVIPAPFVSDFLEVAIRVLEACENATALQEHLQVLQKRVYDLSLAIVNTVPVGSALSTELQYRMNKLKRHATPNVFFQRSNGPIRIFEDIATDLLEIEKTKKWILVLFPEINKDKVGKCVGRLDGALEEFKLGQQLHAEDLLEQIHARHCHMENQLSEVTNHVERIEEVVNKLAQPHTAGTRKDIPPPLGVLYGRDSVVDDITTLLRSPQTSRVCINGPGGMGKTGVALAVIHSPVVKNIFRDYRFWVPCVKATSSDLLRQLLYIQLSITAESYDSLDTLIGELNNSKERRLLLLDNFETPWLSGDVTDQAEVRDILTRLAALPHIALMVTMTSGFPPSHDIDWQEHKLPSLDPSASRDVFRHLYPGVTDTPELDALLTGIGNSPLAITLVAVDGKRSQASPADLFREWKTAGTDMISDMDRTISLSVDRIKSNVAALTLLTILSLLPAGTTGSNLRWWAATVKSHSAAVTALHSTALIEQTGGNLGSSHISVRTTVQAYMAQQERIPAHVKQEVHDACHAFVVSHTSDPDDERFKNDLAALASEEANIQSLLMQISAEDLRPKALEALVVFSLYQLRTKPSTAVALHALKVAGEVQDHRRVAETHQSLGKIFCKLDDYDKAYKHFEDAKQHFKSLTDHRRAGECSMDLAEICMFTQRPSAVVLALAREGQTDLSQNPEDKEHVARGLLGLGYCLRYANQPDAALTNLFEAQSMFEELCYPASTAECLHVIGQVHADQLDSRKAVGVFRKGLAKADQAGDGVIFYRISLSLVGCLISLSLYDEVPSLIQQSLDKSLALGRPLAIAQNLERLGYTYAAKIPGQNLERAKAVYDGARMQYGSIQSFMGRIGEERCARNIGKIEAMKGMDQPRLPIETPMPMY